jgi:alpha-tubulin suppressor-like RCC1 family protein
MIGDDETPASAGDVDVGAEVTDITAGGSHTCALLASGDVRCWGYGGSGRLGYQSTANIGDDETPASAGDVAVGGTVVQIDAGGDHTCALLDTGTIRCWGLGLQGQLGRGNTSSIGDNETPASAGDVPLTGGPAVARIDAGGAHTCALLESGAVRCWGKGSHGELGLGNTDWIGDDEVPSQNVPL